MTGRTLDAAVSILAPEVEPKSYIDQWKSMQDDGATTLILVQGGPDNDEFRTVTNQAKKHVTAAGSIVPEPFIHAGESIVTNPAVPFDATAWFDEYQRNVTAHRDLIQTVRSPAAVSEQLEETLADGLIPTSDGWTSAATTRLRGDRAALRRRSDDLAEAVPAVNPGAILEAHDASDLLEAYRTLLTSYLRYRLERGHPSENQLLAYAMHHDVEPTADEVLLLCTDRPARGAVKLAADTATESVTVAIEAVPSVKSRDAWPLTCRGLNDQVATAIDDAIASELRCQIVKTEDSQLDMVDVGAGDTGERAALLGVNRLRCTPLAYQATDPLEGVIELMNRWQVDGEGPPLTESTALEDVVIVVPTTRHARRLMRLATQVSLPLARAGIIEPFRTRIAVLSLAWLRILEEIRPARGWAVVLEEAGCSPGDIEAWLDGNERPAAMAGFKSDLSRLSSGPAVVAAVADRYNTDDRATHALLASLELAGQQPSPAATLEVLANQFTTGPRRRLEPAPNTHVQIRTDPPPSDTEVVIHVDEIREKSTPAIDYCHPLGVHRTRAIHTIDGQAIERPDLDWKTLQIVRPGATEYRRWRAIASSAKANTHAIIVGDGTVLDGRSVPFS